MHSPSPARPPAPRGEADLDALVSAAVRLVAELPARRPVVGVLRGPQRLDRAAAVTEALDDRGVRAVQCGPVPETDSRHRSPEDAPPPPVHLLLHPGGSAAEPALRTAALWGLPILTGRAGGGGASAGPAGPSGHRRPVIGIRLPGGGVDLAVRHAAVACLRPHAGPAHLLLDNEKVTSPADRELRIRLTPDGRLHVDGAFAARRVSRVRYARPWGPHRLDIDGTPTHEVRTPLRLEALPGRLHVFHP
ncbi:hypothetical protein BJP40_20150 [Streptomyces sp. CC53]|uniref:hypothetical protein n=1 Tax=unclassified Streptomyces TaxID=2593676 RepID=UPI0008DD7ED9|nr:MULTISPECIES: hypothetical protein [unclassified Streptomyces]OII64647.1 hypothetical protein BJP40_20150 [Streptomyces sp. CC53]